MKRLLVLLLAVSYLVQPVTAHDPNYQGVYDLYIDSVVAIESPNEEGSGFVYRQNYIVTNNHVIASGGAVNQDVEVSFGDHTGWRSAEVVGRRPEVDLAVIHVENVPESADSLEVAESPPEHGQRVIVLGNPFSLEGTITHGVVSGVNRTVDVVDEDITLENAIQTDAPVNPGNSGGPMITPEGKVVGVISARRGDNVGFAVPYWKIDHVASEIIAGYENN